MELENDIARMIPARAAQNAALIVELRNQIEAIMEWCEKLEEQVNDLTKE